MPDGDIVEYLKHQDERIGGVESGLKNLAIEISKFRERKEEELPKYFGNVDQIQEELEQQGKFGPKAAPGWQDDFHAAFKMFTQLNDRGDLIEGLQLGGRPPTLMELYQTMDLRGVVWNYGLGWLSALKGGWNEAIEHGKNRSHKIIQVNREIPMPS